MYLRFYFLPKSNATTIAMDGDGDDVGGDDDDDDDDDQTDDGLVGW